MRNSAWLVLAFAPTFLSAQKQPFTVDALLQIHRLSDPQISPDGKSIAIVVSRTNYEEDRYDPQLVLIDVATHAQRVLTRDRRGLGQARWSPDGARLAFLASADGKTQIFVMPMSGVMRIQLPCERRRRRADAEPAHVPQASFNVASRFAAFFASLSFLRCSFF